MFLPFLPTLNQQHGNRIINLLYILADYTYLHDTAHNNKIFVCINGKHGIYGNIYV